MTDLRKIAEMIEVSDPEHGECDREKAFLLNVVVEERQRYLHRNCESSKCTHWEDNHYLLSRKPSRTQNERRLLSPAHNY